MVRPVVAAFRARGHRVSAYVDDFAATGRHGHPSTAAVATAGRVENLYLFGSLGVHLHPTKGVAQCTQRLPLLGFLVARRHSSPQPVPSTRLSPGSDNPIIHGHSLGHPLHPQSGFIRRLCQLNLP